MVERPREKLYFQGPSYLSDSELIAVILGTGVRGCSALELAHQLLSVFGGLHGLASSSPSELATIGGIGQVKAARVSAALTLGQRLTQLEARQKKTIGTPREAVSYLWADLRFLPKETFRCLVVDTKNQVIANELISVGTLNSSLVHPREVFRPVISRSGAGVILAHNHPSGDPTPSREDIELTKRLVDCGKLLGIQVLDHIIVGDNTFVSLREKGIV